MALVTAKATGNWSAGSTWDSDPALPAAGDTVDCAGYTVTIDQDVTVVTIKSTGAGYFAVSAARNITAAILSDTGHSGGAVVRCTHSSGTVSIIGTVTGGTNVGLSIGAAGTVTVTGNVVGGSGANAHGILSSSTGPLNVTGNFTGGSTATAHGVRSSSTATCTFTGNATGASGYGIYNASTGTMSLSGTATGGSVGYGAGNASTGVLTVGRAKGGSVPGTNGANSGGPVLVYEIEYGTNGLSPTAGYAKLIASPSRNVAIFMDSAGGADTALSNDYPTNAQVESGVVFHLGTQTGSYAGGAGGLLTHPGMSGGMRG